jgi:CRISPR/Cas system CSM-associated protein Csm2 small subunit
MTDTPRTDASRLAEAEDLIKRGHDGWQKAEEEVAKLNHQLLKTESDLLQSQDINSFLDTEFRIACKRAEKAEAEVARLREQLASTKQLAIKFWEALEENGFKMELTK